MGAVLTVVAFVALITPDPEIRHTNIEIVLDRSARMAEPLGAGVTRLDLAADELSGVADDADRENVGLRTVGGDCGGDGELQVDIGTGNADDVRDAAREKGPEGRAPLGAAIVAAAGDLGDAARFPPEVSRRIVVITGGTDSCSRGAAERVRERLRGTKLDVDFRLVGVRVPPDDQPALQQLVAEFPDGRAVFANDRAELRRALDDVIRREPVLEGAKAVLALGNEAVEDLKEFARTVDNDPDAADGALERAEGALERSDLPFQALETASASESVSQLHDRVAELRQLQRRVLETARDTIDPARGRGSDPAAQDAYERGLATYEEAVDAHNEKVAEINELVDQLETT